jgi:hypothetical protein
MNNDDARTQRKSYLLMRTTYDITISILILAMSSAMFFADYFKLEQIGAIDSTFRYMFGSICLLYGGFRLYRGIKRDY